MAKNKNQLKVKAKDDVVVNKAIKKAEPVAKLNKNSTQVAANGSGSPKKALNKNTKQPQKAAIKAESDDNEEDENVEDDVQQDGNGSAAAEDAESDENVAAADEEDNDDEEEAANEDEEADSNNEEVKAEGDDAENDDDDDDGAPVEKPIDKKPKSNKQQQKKKKNEMENPACNLYVKNIVAGTEEADVLNHFKSCGNIVSVHLLPKQSRAQLTFEVPASVEKALKLHNSTLKGSILQVLSHAEFINKNRRDTTRTVMLINKAAYVNFEESILRNIFAACGPIAKIDLLCKKHVLAFIIFEETSSVKKAFELNGQTVGGFEVVLEDFNTQPINTTVFVTNLSIGTKPEEVREFFAQSGEVDNVNVNGSVAYVRFKNTDGFCKSFLLNEVELNGRSIFLEPFSNKKKFVMHKKKFNPNRPGAQKRPFHQQGKGGANNKKPKKE